MSIYRLRLIAAFTMLMAVAPSAWAQTTVPLPTGYSDAIARAISELEAKNFAEAREEFRQAHALFPSARSLRGLGVVEFELRNYGESVRFLKQSLASKIRPLEGQIRTETETLLARSKRYLGEVHLEVEPRVTTVTVDGTATEINQGNVLVLDVGEHTIELYAEGRAPDKRVVNVKGGERMTVRVVLRPILDLTQTAQKPDRQPIYKRWWLWSAVAAVAAGAATSVAIATTRDPGTKTEPVFTANSQGAAAFQTSETQ